jgi:hypothetical protein
MSHRIDTLKELRLEKERLEREVTIARNYLHVKLKSTYHTGKKELASKTSWPLVISSLAAFGAQQLNATSSAGRYPERGPDFDLIDGIQQSFTALQKPGKEKWYALIPVALRFLEHWLSSSASSHEHKDREHRPTLAPTQLTPSAVPVVS